MIASHRSLLAIAAVVDIALHARPGPVTAKTLARRHDLPMRHLETALQALVRSGILKSVRGPRGGYELARERRRITGGDIVRAAEGDASHGVARSRLVEVVVRPATDRAVAAFLAVLDTVTVEDLCHASEQRGVFGEAAFTTDFTI